MFSKYSDTSEMEDENSSSQYSILFKSWGTTRLRMLFLTPMIVAILCVVAVLSMMLFQHAEDLVEKDIVRISVSTQNFYEESVRYDTRALKAVMRAILHDEELYKLFSKRNRKELLIHAASLFSQMKQDFSITHMYFTGLDKVNFLRVHAPSRHGDVINRITMQQASSTGVMAHGVEMGPLGTFTLRLVSPWYDEETKKLIGYVEIGMEIDHVLKKLHEFFGVEVLMVVKKSFLNRELWEEGMRTFGRIPRWDQFANVVINEPLDDGISSLVTQSIVDGEGVPEKGIRLLYQEAVYRVMNLPLIDAGGKNVAEMVLVSDISSTELLARKTAYGGILTSLLLGSLLVVFFYWLVGRIGKHIETDNRRLADMATHDGLTKLYNHRMFYSLMFEELERAHRYKHSVSLLMIDIDFFKKVNDNYGHQAGDVVLRELSQLLGAEMRDIDLICRYGGEEITIILPETTLQQAKNTAERLRAKVMAHNFIIDAGESISITISIGVASVEPEQKGDVATLVSEADTALYYAKEHGRNRVCTTTEVGANQ